MIVAINKLFVSDWTEAVIPLVSWKQHAVQGMRSDWLMYWKRKAAALSMSPPHCPAPVPGCTSLRRLEGEALGIQ